MKKKINLKKVCFIAYVLIITTFITYIIANDIVASKNIVKYKYFVSYHYSYEIRGRQIEIGVGSSTIILKYKIKKHDDIELIKGFIMKSNKYENLNGVPTYPPKISIVNYKRMK